MSRIRIAIAGVVNCASSLVQGIAYYASQQSTDGLMHAELGGYRVEDIEVVAAFDVDRRKVGRPLEEAIFALPNNTKTICRELPRSGVTVQMGPILDGVAKHMAEYSSAERFEPSSVRWTMRRPSTCSVRTRPSSSSWATVGYTEPGLARQRPSLRAPISWMIS